MPLKVFLGEECLPFLSVSLCYLSMAMGISGRQFDMVNITIINNIHQLSIILCYKLQYMPLGSKYIPHHYYLISIYLSSRVHYNLVNRLQSHLIIMRIYHKLILGTLIGGSAYLAFYDKQQQENIKGAYLSLKSSCRSAWIVYASYQDYQNSLNHIDYNTPEYHRARHEVHLRVAHRILELSKQNRGIYLKLGQYLGNLQKVVPPQFTQVLKVLQDSAPPVPYEQMKVIFDTDLHKSSSEIFEFIDQTPIASASLAQVHRARLADSGKEVAIKLQYPFLQVQSKWDLIMLKNLTIVCNYLVKRFNNANFDFLKLFNEWTATLVEQLDFKIELSHALKTKQLFANHNNIYIPHYYKELSSSRLLVMEFIYGVKISQKEKIEELGIDPKKVASNLLEIFATMIYQHGFVHCDAHPGNILIRAKNNSIGHQIVLLDHGLYRQIRPKTILNYSNLFINLMLQDKQKVHQYAQKLNIHEHFEYLPLIFLWRSRRSKKPIGENITAEEKSEFREKDLSNFDAINRILQDLPPQLMYIIRASNLIAAHNIHLGGTNRQRLFLFARHSLRASYRNYVSYLWHYIAMLMRILLFETLPSLYGFIFGTLE